MATSPHMVAARAASAALQCAFGDALAAVVLFGSVARGRERPDSDVDLLVVIDGAPVRTTRALDLVAPALDPVESALRRKRPHACLAPIVKSPDRVERGGPLFYDMTLQGEAVVLFDRRGFLAHFLDTLRDRMRALGSVRCDVRGHPYWDLKPDWKRGDVVDL